MEIDSSLSSDAADGRNGSAPPPFIEHKAYARVGLLGNPSDVYFGRTISFSLGNFSASVRLQPSDDLVIQPHPVHDLVRFDSIDHLVNRLENEGYYGGVRLLMSICKVFYKYCIDNKIDLKGGNFALSYDTNIPRQTGLSGSSAIVCAALSCLLDFYKVRHLVKVEVRPNLILSAEMELGIVAGLQDRVAQVYGGLVYMDFCKEHMDSLGYGMYTPMDISVLPPLHLIYAENPSDSGKVHSTVRKRWLDGDKFIISSMEEVAKIALEGRTALLEKDYTKLAELMNCNFDLRSSLIEELRSSDQDSLAFQWWKLLAQDIMVDESWIQGGDVDGTLSYPSFDVLESCLGHGGECRNVRTILLEWPAIRPSMFGDDALGSLNLKMVEVARSVGAASKFTGSGGAVIAFCPNGPSQAEQLKNVCRDAGFVVQPAIVVPSFLNEEDLKTLSHC